MEAVNLFLTGDFAPVDEVEAVGLEVTGTIPAELAGRYVRIGPNPVTPPDPATYQWFTGTGMVHGVRLLDGRAHWYRARYVCDDLAAAALGRPKAPGPRHGDDDPNVVNTHVFGHAGRTLALVEGGGLPMELSYELETLRTCDFDGTLPGGFAAHPLPDPDTGELHAITYFWADDHVKHVVVGPDGRVSRHVAVPVADGPMIHSTFLTERFIAVLDLPVCFNLQAAMAGTKFPYQWNPQHQARVGLLPRGPGASAADVRWFEVEPCYMFHPVNAYETDDGHVIMDTPVVDRVFDVDSPLNPAGKSPLYRYDFDLGRGTASRQLLDERSQEFPRIDDRLLGRKHRYAYSVAMAGDDASGPLLRFDTATGRTEVHDLGPGRSSMEPVFVPRAPDAAEDDGWVVSMLYDANMDRSELAIFAAQDLGSGPVARVHLPRRVPFGFHGNWIPDSAVPPPA